MYTRLLIEEINIAKYSNKELVELYFIAKIELDSMEYHLSRNYSPPLFNQCCQVKQLIKDLRKILGTNVTRVP